MRKVLIWSIRVLAALLFAVLLLLAVLTGSLYWKAASAVPDHRLADAAVAWHGCIPPGGKQEFVPLDEMPLRAIPAFLAAWWEPDFLTREPYSLLAIARKLRERRHVRNSWVSDAYIGQLYSCQKPDNRPQSLQRKFEQTLLRYRLEHDVPRRRILETVINSFYAGRGNFGMGAAARAYLGKPLGEADLGELAFLAALPGFPDNAAVYADKARGEILRRMVQAGAITAEEAEAAKREPLNILKQPPASARP
ncbi:MAG: transglycosylase domain-containing protein [Rhodomicrobium sp.]